MTHMVIFRSPDGKPGYHQAPDLDDAVRFTEMVRNHEQVMDARIFRMEEVPIEFKTYFKVEIGNGGPAPAPEPEPQVEAPAAAAPAEQPEPPAEAEGGPQAEEPAVAEGPAGDGQAEEQSDGDTSSADASPSPGRFGLFTRS